MKIKLKDIVVKNFFDESLQGISLEIAAGSLVHVIGDKLSGKTLLTKVIAGIVEPDKGTVLFDGNDIYKSGNNEIKRLRSMSSFVFQNGGLISNLSIRENLLLPYDFHYPDIPIEEKMRKINNYFNKFRLPDILNNRPSNVSRDLIKVIGFIRAVLLEPKVICMNEPFSDCEISSVAMILNEIKYLKDKGVTQIIINQTSKDVYSLADSRVLLANGKLEECSDKELENMFDAIHSSEIMDKGINIK